MARKSKDNPPHDPGMPSRNTGHPLLRNPSQATELAALLGKREEAEKFKIDELDKWKASINRFAATPDGKAFLRAMLAHSDLFAAGTMKDANKLVQDKIRASFYLEWVRPFLEPELRAGVE